MGKRATETPPETPESGGENPGSGMGQGTPPANGGENRTFTQEELNRIVSDRLAEERRKSDDKIKKDREKEESEREQTRLVEEGKFKEAADKERAARIKAEQERDDERAATRTRIVKAEIRSAAAELRFADPADAINFIDLASVEVDDNLEPQNVKTLLEDLAKRKPYLLKQEGAASGGIPRTPNAQGLGSREELAQHEYEAQKRSGRYTAF